MKLIVNLVIIPIITAIIFTPTKLPIWAKSLFAGLTAFVLAFIYNNFV